MLAGTLTYADAVYVCPGFKTALVKLCPTRPAALLEQLVVASFNAFVTISVFSFRDLQGARNFQNQFVHAVRVSPLLL